MASVLCDPNYNPRALYAQIEALQYFYEHVYLYGTSQTHIQNANLEWPRLESLIKEGFVIPVGRAFWFNQRDREKRSESARRLHFGSRIEDSWSSTTYVQHFSYCERVEGLFYANNGRVSVIRLGSCTRAACRSGIRTSLSWKRARLHIQGEHCRV
jgi:hypothetical protein